MSSLARLVLAHRKLIVLFWVIVLVVGGATSGMATDRLSTSFTLPGQDGYDTSQKLLEKYGTDGQTAPTLMVLVAPDGAKVDDAAAAKTFAAAQQAVPSVRVVDKTSSSGSDVFSTDDGHAQFAYVFPPPQEGFVSTIHDPLENALKNNAPAGTTATLTGLDELATSSDGGDGPSVLVETLLAGLGALAILLFVFASALALVPLLIAAVSIMGTFLILLGLTTFADVSFIVQFLVSLVGLGVAIDYSLLLVTRWREERDHGRSNHDAVVVAMQTAGHAVLFSGITVAIGLFALVVLPVPFLRSIGYGGMLIPLVSVSVTLTLLPAILGGIGPKIDWPKVRHENNASKFWTAWGKGIVRFRWPAAILALVVLVALIVPALDLKIGSAQSDSLAKSGPAYDALHVLENAGMPAGILTPIEVLSNQSAAPSVVDAVRSLDKVDTVFAETGPSGVRGDNALVLAVPTMESVNSQSVQAVRDIKDSTDNIDGVVGVVGFGSLQLDYLKGVYGNFPYAFALILLVTFILLARAFRSLLLPLKAIILNVASLAATFGGLVLFWQMGHGSEQIYGIEATGGITFWLPIMIFAFLFGLSMDYEVFILSRMREEYDDTGSTQQAVTVGLGRTGRLVTSAALILFLSFLSLSTGPQTDIKLLATGLGFGILLDATIIRMLLVPALVSLFGEWNWVLPVWAAKILRVEPSPRRKA